MESPPGAFAQAAVAVAVAAVARSANARMIFFAVVAERNIFVLLIRLLANQRGLYLTVHPRTIRGATSNNRGWAGQHH